MEKFQWPLGTQAQLKVYPKNHPQRIPTELYFANQVREDIRGVRSADPNHLPNLWLLIDSLKEINNPTIRAGFNTWLWAIESVLGGESCREIGLRVCREEGFTIDEGLHLQAQNPSEWVELTAFPQRGRWYQVKSHPTSDQGRRLAGQIVSAVEIDLRKTKTVSVFTPDVFTNHGGIAIRLPIEDLTYRRG